MTNEVTIINLPSHRLLLRRESRRMAAYPVPLVRPVVVLGGWRSPSLMASALARRLASLTSGSIDDFLRVSYPLASSIKSAASIARHAIESHPAHAANPRAAPPEFDIVAISMGGLIARYLASGLAWGGSPPTFRVRRIFSISTPHRGASLARWIRPDSAARAMRPGSAFLSRLDGATTDPGSASGQTPRYPIESPELICYVQRLDWWVGTWNTAPRLHPLRCANASGPIGAALSHFTAHANPAIVIDVARHLRGEPGLDVGLPDPTSHAPATTPSA